MVVNFTSCSETLLNGATCCCSGLSKTLVLTAVCTVCREVDGVVPFPDDADARPGLDGVDVGAPLEGTSFVGDLLGLPLAGVSLVEDFKGTSFVGALSVGFVGPSLVNTFSVGFTGASLVGDLGTLDGTSLVGALVGASFVGDFSLVSFPGE